MWMQHSNEIAGFSTWSFLVRIFCDDEKYWNFQKKWRLSEDWESWTKEDYQYHWIRADQL